MGIKWIMLDEAGTDMDYPVINSTMVVFMEEYENVQSTTTLADILNVTGNHSALALTSNDTIDPDVSSLIMLSDIVGIWITGVVCLFGLAGNIVSFIVLLQAHGASPMFYVLRAVSVSDAMFLLMVFINQTVVNLYGWTGLLEWCYIYRGYIQYSTWPILMITQMSTVWLTVLVSLERYVAVCHPLKAAAVCTLSKVRKAVALIFSVSILYNLPRYIEWQIVDKSSMEPTVYAEHKLFRYLYNLIMYSLLLFIIPLLTLIFLNAKLVLALREGKKQWKTLQFRQRKEQNLSIIPLTIVLIFFLCGTPSLSINIIDALNDQLLQKASYVIFLVVANFLITLNSACNFIIYCLLGKKFRSKLKEMFASRCFQRRTNAYSVANTQVSDF